MNGQTDETFDILSAEERPVFEVSSGYVNATTSRPGRFKDIGKIVVDFEKEYIEVRVTMKRKLRARRAKIEAA